MFDFGTFDQATFDGLVSSPSLVPIVPQIITSTDILQKPVDCVLIGDQPQPGDRENEIHPPNIRQKTKASYGGGFSEGKSEFTSKTSNKGYD